MKNFENVLNLLGRLAIAALFLPAGLSKLMGVEGAAGYFTSLGFSSCWVWLVNLRISAARHCGIRSQSAKLVSYLCPRLLPSSVWRIPVWFAPGASI
jgi:uncharacterized membrane protein YphA (DoxX/SURF4 family)